MSVRIYVMIITGTDRVSLFSPDIATIQVADTSSVVAGGFSLLRAGATYVLARPTSAGEIAATTTGTGRNM